MNSKKIIKYTEHTLNAPRKTRTKNTAQNEASSATSGTKAVATALRPNEAPTIRRGPNN